MNSPRDDRRTVAVRRDDAASAYVLDVDGRAAGAAYFRELPGEVVFVHTEIDPDLEGEHLGSLLAKQALEDVRSRGERVIPMCPFIAAYIERHPEYRDLLAAPSD